MIVKHEYLGTSFSNNNLFCNEGLSELSLKFDYPFQVYNNKIALVIKITVIDKAVFENKEVEIITSESNFRIETDYKLIADDVYPFIAASVSYLKEYMREIGIHLPEAKAPPFELIQDELKELIQQMSH